MAIKQEYTREDFDKLNRVEMHRLWYIKAYTEKKIAKLYGVTRKEVHEKRKNELGLGWINSAILYMMKPRYQNKRELKK